MMFRPLFIQPSYPSSPFSSINLPVGIGYLTEILEQAGAEYEICDLQIESETDLLRKISTFAPSHIGLSLMSLDWDSHYSLICKIKKFREDIPIVVGGPHAAYVREAIFKECPQVDIIVFNEGEPFIVDMLDGKPLENIPGIAICREGKKILTAGREFVEDINIFPFPRYTKLDLQKYGATMRLISSRGCPFSCIFCGAHISMGRKWRAKSVQKMVEEIRYWHGRGYRKINFVDSNFFMSRDRVSLLCDELRGLKLKISITSDGMRANDYDEEVMRAMQEFGLTSVAIGIESANEDILKIIRKGESLGDIRRSVEGLQRLGIDIIAFFIIGLPGEALDHVFNSFDFALEYPGISSAFFFNPNPLEGTELYDICKKNGYLRSSIEGIRRNIGGMGDEIPISTPELTTTVRRELMQLAKKVSEAVKLRHRLYKHPRKINVADMESMLKNLENLNLEINEMKNNIRSIACSQQNESASPGKTRFSCHQAAVSGGIPKMSVIIPTCNRAASLEKTLHSLTLICDPRCPYEIIVVDNGSIDSTRQVAEFFQRTLLSQLKYVVESNPGLHNGRHRGAFEAAGSILCYLDDDVKVDSMWLRSVRETFETTEAVLVGGKILPEYEQSPPDWLKEFVKPIRSGGYHIGQLTLIDMGEQLREIDPIYVWGANFSIRKEVLFECGGFHPDSMPKELLYFRGDGETGLSISIREKGLKAFYHPGAMVRHCISKDRLTKEYFFQRRFSQGISDSFTEIRKTGKLPGFPSSTALDSYQQGKIFHCQQIQNNPQLLSWVLKKEYYSELKMRTPAAFSMAQCESQLKDRPPKTGEDFNKVNQKNKPVACKRKYGKTGYISAKETVGNAKSSGLSVLDYIEDIWGHKGQTKKIVDAICEAIGRQKIESICEIGPGTGRYMGLFINKFNPSLYHFYEPAEDWKNYLLETFYSKVQAKNTDGRSLSETANDSCDMVIAHGVFIFLSCMNSFEYFKEMVRVCKKNGFIVFDIYSDKDSDPDIINKWIDLEISYQVILPEQSVIRYFDKYGVKIISSFQNKHHLNATKYMVFQKTADVPVGRHNGEITDMLNGNTDCSIQESPLILAGNRS